MKTKSKTPRVRIVARDSEHGGGKTGQLSPNLTALDINNALGLGPIVCDHEDGKVTKTWLFTAFVDGRELICSIWDYRGARWSTNGSGDAFDAIFGDAWSHMSAGA